MFFYYFGYFDYKILLLAQKSPNHSASPFLPEKSDRSRKNSAKNPTNTKFSSRFVVLFFPPSQVEYTTFSANMKTIVVIFWFLHIKGAVSLKIQ